MDYCPYYYTFLTSRSLNPIILPYTETPLGLPWRMSSLEKTTDALRNCKYYLIKNIIFKKAVVVEIWSENIVLYKRKHTSKAQLSSFANRKCTSTSPNGFDVLQLIPWYRHSLWRIENVRRDVSYILTGSIIPKGSTDMTKSDSSTFSELWK